MANGDLDLQRRGGELTGSNLNLSTVPPVQKTAVPDLSNVSAAPQPQQGILTKPFGEFSIADRLLFGLKSGLQGAGPALAQRRNAIASRSAQQAATGKRQLEVFDRMLKGFAAVEGTEDFVQKTILIDAIAKQFETIDPKAARSFRDLADSPTVTEIALNPQLAQKFGGLANVLSVADGTLEERSALRTRIIGQKRAGIHDKVLRIKQEFPELSDVDLDADGTVTTNEAQVWIRRLIDNDAVPRDLKLTPAEMETFTFEEFEDDVAAMFGARTRAGVAAEKDRAAVSLGRISARTPAGNVLPAVFNPKTGIHEVSTDGGTTFGPAEPGTQFFTASATGTLEQVAPGQDPLTKTQRGKVQESLSSLEKQAKQLDKISDDFADEKLTLAGRTKAFVGKGLDFLGDLGTAIDQAQKFMTGMSLVEFSATQNDFIGQVEAFFQAYRKNVTGAQAAFAEFAQLKKAVISGELPPAQFKKRMGTLMKTVREDIAIKKKLLEQGIDIRPPRESNFGNVSDADLLDF